MTQEELALMESSEMNQVIVVTPGKELEIIDKEFSYPDQADGSIEEIRQITTFALNLSESDHAVSIILERSDFASTYLCNVMTFSVAETISIDGATPFFRIKSTRHNYTKYIPEKVAKTIDLPGQDPEGWREVSKFHKPGQFKGTDIELLCNYIRYTFNCCIGRRPGPIVIHSVRDAEYPL